MRMLIFIGGIYHLVFASFHLSFWRLFGWREDLRHISSTNRNVMQILNLRLIYVFLSVAFLSFFFADALLSSGLGKMILIGIALFWAMRAIEQIVFFGLRKIGSLVIFLIFLLGAGIYICPVLF